MDGWDERRDGRMDEYLIIKSTSSTCLCDVGFVCRTTRGFVEKRVGMLDELA
jgi:hypothetical protein